MEEEEDDEKNIQKKECFISFAKINKYYLFPFLAPIFCMTSNYLLHLINKENYHNIEFTLALFVNFAYILGGSLYFITYIREKTEETKNNAIVYQERKTINLIYKEDKPNKSKTKIFFILLFMSLLLATYIIIYTFSNHKNLVEKRLYYLFFISIFSKFILKSEIYRHQVLSLSISFIGLIILFFPAIKKIGKKDIIMNICNVFSAIFYSIFLVLIKYLTHKYYVSPLFCLLSVGLFSLIITFIAFIIYSLIKKDDFSLLTKNFQFSENKKDKKLYIYGTLSLFFSALLQIFSFLVVYYFSPILLAITDIISPMLSWILISIQEGETSSNIIFNTIGYFLELIAAFIYNEIIICNFFQLNKYTKKYIVQRQNEEFNSIKMTENESELENDTSYNTE